MAIREILSSLRERLHRWTSPDSMEDLTDNARGLPPTPSYEAALWAAHQKMMETATLQSDLDRLNSKPRGRSRTRSQSGDHCRMWPGSQQRRHSGSQRRARSPQWGGKLDKVPKPRPLKHYQDERAHSPDHTQSLPDRWVSFHMPEGEDMTTVKEPVTVELTAEDFGNLARTPGTTVRDPYLVERAGGHP